jgi:hypothetical protein
MKIKIIIREIFYFLSAGLVIFWLMEIIKPRIVLAYLDLNWLFLFWLLAAIAMLFWRDEEE